MPKATIDRLTSAFGVEEALAQCGYHEAGHAFCFAVYGIPQNGIVLRARKRWLSDKVDYKAYVSVEDGAKDRADQADLSIAILAGVVSESRWLHQEYGVDFDDTLNWLMHDPDVSGRDMSDLAEALSNADYGRARAIRDTKAVTGRHWGRITKIARRAIAKGGLTGSQVRRYAGV